MSRGQAGLQRDGAGGQEREQVVEVKVDPLRQAVLVQEAVLRELDNQIEELTLRAPVDGVISMLTRHPGDVVGAGLEVVSLVAARPGVVVVIVPEHQARRAVPGASVELHRDALGAPALGGRVIEIAPEVEESPIRVRPSPSIPAWGRRIAIKVASGEEILPGEAFRVSFP
jgi:multidrug resistance efflux pump